MSEFSDVTIVKAANIYFDGKVTSRAVKFADGTRKTLGIMMPGEYTFDTAEAEIVEILSGKMDVKLPGSEKWRACAAGDSFDVPAKVHFDLKVHEVTDYCCSYVAG